MECSETSAYKLQTPGNYPKESIQQLSVESPVLIHIHILVLASIDQGLASPTLFMVDCVVLFLPAKICTNIHIISSDGKRKFSDLLCSHLFLYI